MEPLEANRSEGDVDKLVKARFFPDSKGLMVDIGAARPDYISTSAHFRLHGWTVLSIEPNPIYDEHYERLDIERIPYAVGGHDEDNVDFTIVNSHETEYEGGNVTFESFSSFSIKEKYANLKSDLDVTTIKVNMRMVDSILQERGIEAVDIVSVDVEGWELEALSGLTICRPKVLIVENLFYERSYKAFMGSRGYTMWRRVYPNEVYVLPSQLSYVERLYSWWHEIYTYFSAHLSITSGKLQRFLGRSIRKTIATKG